MLAIIIGCNDCGCNIVIDPSGDIEKVDLVFHPLEHSFGKTGKFLADVLLKCRTLPAPHLLDFTVLKACKQKCIRATTSKQVCVHSINWDSFLEWVAQDGGGHFYACSDVSVHDIISSVVGEECRQVSVIHLTSVSNVCNPLHQGLYWAVYGLSDGMLVDTYSLPAILLVIKFYCCVVRL